VETAVKYLVSLPNLRTTTSDEDRGMYDPAWFALGDIRLTASWLLAGYRVYPGHLS
jgi:hypothetical protein